MPVWFSPATLLVVLVILFPGSLLAVEFMDAQAAATEGRYDEVVSILTTVIERGELEVMLKLLLIPIGVSPTVS
jgi:hypothetical protein